MTAELKILSKSQKSRPYEFHEVEELAQALLAYMRHPQVEAQISKKHKLNAKSIEIQNILLKKADELGFKSEKKGLFNSSPTRRLRPDFYRSVGKSGVIMEVERGKTIENNMDVLDIWKTHICTDADYLFIVVPQIRSSANGSRRFVYKQVCNRLEPFFQPENYINVEAVFVFGY